MNPALFVDLLESLSDADMRAEIEVFRNRATMGSWLVWLVLCHYVAHRMQLFRYLKRCGREELTAVDLWAGVDGI